MKYAFQRDGLRHQGQAFPQKTQKFYSGQKQSNARANPMQDAFFNGKSFDVDLATKSACRAMNIEHLKRNVFDDSVAQLAERAQIAPQRLKSIIDLELPVGNELAEHMELSLGLRAGWLDQRRDQWTESDTAIMKEHFSFNHSSEEKVQAINSVQIANAEEGVTSTIATPSLGPEAVSSTAAPACAATVAPPSDFVKSEDFSPSSTANPSEGHQKMFPHLEALTWLHGQLKVQQRGTTSKIARHMGRNPNDVSSWLNGLRGMPLFCLAPLIQAIDSILPDLAQEARLRFKAQSVPVIHHATPASSMKNEAVLHSGAVSTDDELRTALPSPNKHLHQGQEQAHAPSAPTSTSASSFVTRDVAGLQYMQYPTQQPLGTPPEAPPSVSSAPAASQAATPKEQEELRMVVAQTLNTMAEVMKALMESNK